jgi:two-component system LytT family response regulator
MKLQALIADDEPLARERLKFLLSSDDEIEIACECRNGREVVDALKAMRIDVLFLDIQMPGKNGLEALNQIGDQIGSAQLPVTVFVTAHSEYALQAFEVQALDYLTKPIEPERLQASLFRVRQQLAARAALVTQEQLKTLLGSIQNGNPARSEYPARLLVPNGGKNSFINVQDIDWIEAADYYCCLHVGTRSLMLRESIKQLAETLDPNTFVRIHRSIIVNVKHVCEIFREGRSEGWVVLENGQRLRMSKPGWQSLLTAGRR